MRGFPSFFFKKRLWVLLFVFFFSFAAYGFAGDDIEALKEQIRRMTEQLKQMQQKLNELEKTNKETVADVEELDERVSKNEMHTYTDKVSFGIELRTKLDSLHYNDIRIAPNSMTNAFFTPVASGGFNGATLQQIQTAMANMAAAGTVPEPEKVDADNDTIFTSRFRLEMKARLNEHISFAGRATAYKVWGESTGGKFNHGSLGDVTLDGNTSSLPHGDTIRLERAYFNLKGEVGRVPVNFSLGRRPSTEGPPLEYSMYSLEGGSPLATIINWQFDGASFNFDLEDVTGIPGAAFKLCYGVGFESDWGNSYSLTTNSDVDDVHLFGFIATLYNDDVTSVVLNYAHAWDITDGFTGLTVMPFIVSKQDSDGDGVDEYYFSRNSGGFISRLEPTTDIGDWDALSVLLRSQISGIDFFVAGSLSHTDPSNISENPFYEMMGQGLLSSNGNLEDHTGYAIWAGVIFPMPMDGRLGLEYNWGSKYWFPFTGAEDNLVASKAAARGQVFEAYYIQPIYNQNFFLKLGGQYFDYEYTGTGNPLGEPVKISDATSFDTLNAVVDKVWAYYLSAYLRF